MNKFVTVLLHTFMTKLKSKPFIISTVIMAIGILVITNIDRIIDMFGGDEAKRVIVVDQTNQLFAPLQAHVREVSDDIELVEATKEESEAEEQVKDGKYEGMLVLSMDGEGLPIATYKALTLTDSETINLLERSLQSIKSSLAAQQLQLSPDQLAKLTAPLSFQKEALSSEAKTEEELSQARFVVYLMILMLYIVVIVYSSMIATEVASEKSSRVMEILISSVSPVTHMFGKILGIALLGISQIIFLLTIGYISLTQLRDGTEDVIELLGLRDLSLSLIMFAIIFFLLGYFLYATFGALLGSLVSRTEEVQQTITPMMFLIIIAFFISMYGLENPNASFVTISSFIPFFTPMTMFLRIGMLNVPVWEIVLSMSLLIATVVFFAVFGARIYKGGVLMYGKANIFKDIRKAILLTKKE
jgi:ABC-2 type transport system permease protein